MRKLEEIARAMHDAEDALSEPKFRIAWENCVPFYREAMLDQALAAVRAMREPSKAMIEAWMSEAQRQHFALDEFSDPIFPVPLHRAVIDAILSEEDGG